MKKLYCMNCGAQIKGGIPNECSCGAKFDLADTKTIKNNDKHYILCSINVSTAYSYSFWQTIFTSGNNFICFTPDYRYFWCRIVQTILVHLGLVTMTNIEIK